MKGVTTEVVHLFRLDGWTTRVPAHGMIRGSPAWEHQLRSRRNALDLFEDQRGGHCGWRTMRGRKGQKRRSGRTGPGHIGPAGQGNTSRFILKAYSVGSFYSFE